MSHFLNLPSLIQICFVLLYLLQTYSMRLNSSTRRKIFLICLLKFSFMLADTWFCKPFCKLIKQFATLDQPSYDSAKKTLNRTAIIISNALLAYWLIFNSFVIQSKHCTSWTQNSHSQRKTKFQFSRSLPYQYHPPFKMFYDLTLLAPQQQLSYEFRKAALELNEYAFKTAIPLLSSKAVCLVWLQKVYSYSCLFLA